MTCPLTYQNIGLPGGTGSGVKHISHKYINATAEINAAIMEEGAEMECLQQARGLIDHTAGTADEIGA